MPDANELDELAKTAQDAHREGCRDLGGWAKLPKSVYRKIAEKVIAQLEIKLA